MAPIVYYCPPGIDKYPFSRYHISMSDLQKIEQRLGKIESTMVTREEFHTAFGVMVTRDEFQAGMDKMVTRDEFKASEDRLTSRMDEMITILQRLDQERIFTVEWIRRIESDVERVKKQLHLA